MENSINFECKWIPKEDLWQAVRSFRKRYWPEDTLSYKKLADRVHSEFRIRADAPRALTDGTMKRFTDWHEKNM